MAENRFYKDAHLVVSAIRILDHQNRVPPSVEAVGACLSFSPEQISLTCRKLARLGIIEIVEGAYGSKLFVKNHLLIEDIPETESEDGLAEELKKFQASRKGMTDKIESIKAEQAEKRKSLFAELEKKLKSEVDKK